MKTKNLLEQVASEAQINKGNMKNELDGYQILKDILYGEVNINPFIKTDSILDNSESVSDLEKIVESSENWNEIQSLLMNKEDGGWIQTYTGIKFFPLRPKKEDISIEDIAHALSMQCRFTGHVKKFYSIAQHSVYVSYLCDSSDALYGLLHDASEAYVSDVSSPLKKLEEFKAYINVEKNLQSKIYDSFGLNADTPKSVKKADMVMLATEARDLMSPIHVDWRNREEPYLFNINPLSPEESKEIFLKRFEQLYGKK